MIDGQHFFDQPVDYPYFNKHNMLPVDLSTQLAVNADPKAIQQVNLTGHLDRDGNATMLFTIEEAKTILCFSQGTVEVL